MWSDSPTLTFIRRRDNRGVARGDGRSIHDRSRRLAVVEETVEQRAELVDRTQVDLEIEAILTGDPMALADLCNLGGELRDAGQLPRGRLDPHDRGQLVAEPSRVDLGAVAGDHAGPFETLHALRYRGRGEIHTPAQLGHRHTTLAGQLAEDLTVGIVEARKIRGGKGRNSVVHFQHPV